MYSLKISCPSVGISGFYFREKKRKKYSKTLCAHRRLRAKSSSEQPDTDVKNKNWHGKVNFIAVVCSVAGSDFWRHVGNVKGHFGHLVMRAEAL